MPNVVVYMMPTLMQSPVMTGRWMYPTKKVRIVLKVSGIASKSTAISVSATRFTKMEIFYIFIQVRYRTEKNLSQLTENCSSVYPTNFHYLKNIGWGSGIRKKLMPDPGSATLTAILIERG